MANDLVAGGSRAVAAADGNPWAEAARGVEDGAYLKFNGNDGLWSFGQDDEELPEGSRVVADMETLAFGWICWIDSSVEEEVLVPVMEGKPPLEHELTDYDPDDPDDGWREAASLSMVLESVGDDDQDEMVGTALLWKTSTGGQVRQIRKLSGAFGRAFAQHPGEFPIVELGIDSYTPKNKKHGKVKYSPTLKIVGWMTAAELEGIMGGDFDDEDEEEREALPAPKKTRKKAEDGDEEPKRGRRRKAEPEPEEDEGDEPEVEEDEEEEEKPSRRRRTTKAEPEPEEDEDEEEEEKPRRRRRKAEPEPEEDEEEEEKPRRRRRKAEPEEEEEDEGDDAPAPAPRGRSRGRGGARLRKFD